MSLKDLIKVANYYNVKYSLEAEESLIKEAAGKYDHIDFRPPESVAKAAARGLELRKKNKGKGGLSVQQAHKQGIGSGVARAASLKNRKTLSPATVRRMKAFFDRHEKNKGASGGKPLAQDKGHISWLLWGGDPGRSWANKIVNQMNAADKKTVRAAIEYLLRKNGSASIYPHPSSEERLFNPDMVGQVIQEIGGRENFDSLLPRENQIADFISAKEILLEKVKNAYEEYKALNPYSFDDDDEKAQAYQLVIQYIENSIDDAKNLYRN